MKSPAAQPYPASAKPVLAVDIDDVLGEHYEVLADYFNLVYNLKITLAELHSGILRRVMAEVDRPREEVIAEAERHFPKVFGHVRLVGAVGWGRGFNAVKTGVLQKIGAVALIDDNLRHCTEAAAAGLQAILFGSYPWNRTEILPPRVVRAENWSEVERLLYHD